MKRCKASVLTKTRPCQIDLGKMGDYKYYDPSHQGYNYEAWSKDYVMSQYNGAMANRAAQHIGLCYPPTLLESITTRSGRGMVMKDCIHTKMQYVYLPFLLAHRHYSDVWTPYSGEYLVKYWRLAMYSTYYENAVEHAARHGFVNDQMFSARAYWSMRPKLESGVSLINTIFELKDFQDIGQFLFSPKGLARVVAKNSRKLVSANRALLGNGHTLPNPNKWLKRKYKSAADYAQSKSAAAHVSDMTNHSSRLLSEGVLAYNLAIMPTIRDAMAIHAAAQKRVYEQLLDFKAMGDEGARSHYSEKDILLNTVVPGKNNSYVFGAGKLITRLQTATMVSYYRLLWERFEDMYPKWWGLEVGADEVWNFLPLSFVLDYVLTVGKSLEYMDRDPRIEVLGTEYCESVKVTAELGHYVIQSYRTPHLVIDGVYKAPVAKDKYHLVSGTCGKYYQRNVMEPYKGPALPKVKLPSKQQTANMLALVRCLLF